MSLVSTRLGVGLDDDTIENLLSHLKRRFKYCQLAFSPPKHMHTYRPQSLNTAAPELEAKDCLPAELIEVSSLPQRLDGCGVNISLCPCSFWMQHNSVILS